jgi:hypothetical protein
MRRTGQNEMRFAGQKRCAEVAKLMRRPGQKPCEYADTKQQVFFSYKSVGLQHIFRSV